MKVLIIGGGFAGIKSALELSKDKKNQITLVSDRSDFQYYPALYSSATGKSRLESWVPLGEIFGSIDNVHVVIDSIEKIDNKSKEVFGSSGKTYQYSTLIIAIGVVTTYFNIPGLETYAYGIKSEEEILRLKQRIFVDIAEGRKIDKNYVVVGAGPTGVELSAALGSYLRRLCRHYKVSHSGVRVRLVEAAPRVLPRSSEQVSRAVTRRLKNLGVKVETGKKVERANAKSLIVSGKNIETHTVIWTSGVTNHPLFKEHPDIFKLTPNGKVEVDRYLSAHPGIYVLGDNAGTPYSGLAQTALHDALFVTRNLKLHAKGKKPKEYKAVMPVSAIPVGNNWAVIEWRWLRIYGWPASVVRRLANFVGYLDILPFGTSLGAWHASRVYQHDYFTPTDKLTKSN